MNQTLVASSPDPNLRGAGNTYLCVTDLYEQQLREGELIAARCLDCGQMSFPPEPSCKHCQSTHISCLALSGRGRLCSAAIAEHSDDLSLGDILLEEGIELRALLVGGFQEPDELAARLKDKPVEVVPSVLYTQGLSILAFAPA
jgi:uncharacterized OB-fold protein